MILSGIKKTYYYLKRNGLMKTLGATVERICSPYYKDYTYKEPAGEELEKQKQVKWKKPVLISILIPAYETKEEYLRCLLDSLEAQTYPYWQAVVAEGGKSKKTGDICYSYQDERIVYVSLPANEGISGNTNQALSYVKGEYTGLLDHDDFLTPDALYEMAKALEEGKKEGIIYDFLYSDEDKCDERGEIYYEPHFKTDFNFDLLLTNNYICHFLLMSTELMKTLKLRREFDGAQDFDLVLRAVGKIMDDGRRPEDHICHIPKVLYHWRCHSESTASNPASKEYAYKAGKMAIYDFCKERGWQVDVKSLAHLGFYRVVYKDGIFSGRHDIGAVGRKERKGLRSVSHIFDKEGRPLYDKIPFWYTGYIHRAVLTQNAYQLDIDNWEINPGVLKKYEQQINEIKERKDLSKNKKRTMLCEFLRKKGYRLYWDPGE